MSAWWDWGPINTVVNVFWGGLSAATDATQAVQAIPMVMAGIIINVVQVIFYPVVLVIQLLQNMVLHLVIPFIDFFNLFINVGNTLIAPINLFSGVFPGPWVIGLGLIVLAQIALRIYYFAKDIEILGNKI